MDKVIVYFHNGCKAQFDARKIVFLCTNGTAFRLNDGDDSFRPADFLNEDYALINWENVSFVQKAQTQGRDDD